jgi:hypothetical protein
MTQFVADNNNIAGSLYFWRKTNNAASPSYCTWAGGTFTSNNEAQVVDPNGLIQAGQGFFVSANGSGTSLMFNNGQRVSDNTNQFFRNAQVVERNRMWLNATNTAGEFSQMAVGYISGATQGVDMYDAEYYNDGPIALNSIINSADYVIQGRALPFDSGDVVPLSFKATVAGGYSIAIDHLDGFFAGSQDIFLRDNLTGSVTDLKAGAYAFTSEAGAFASRFEIVYQNLLGVQTPTFNENNVVIYKQGEEIVINSGKTLMSNVKVFDIRGRLLLEKKAINAYETRLNMGTTKEVLLVQMTTATDVVVTKKVIN